MSRPGTKAKRATLSADGSRASSQPPPPCHVCHVVASPSTSSSLSTLRVPRASRDPRQYCVGARAGGGCDTVVTGHHVCTSRSTFSTLACYLLGCAYQTVQASRLVCSCDFQELGRLRCRAAVSSSTWHCRCLMRRKSNN